LVGAAETLAVDVLAGLKVTAEGRQRLPLSHMEGKNSHFNLCRIKGETWKIAVRRDNLGRPLFSMSSRRDHSWIVDCSALCFTSFRIESLLTAFEKDKCREKTYSGSAAYKLVAVL
jgi:hypothetical protein